MNNLDRRDFVKKSLITGAAITVVPRYVLGGSGYQAPSDKLRVGIIGTGGRLGVLIDAFQKNPAIQILALCDVDLPKCNEFAKKFNIKADIYQDYHRIMERKDIDAVAIVTPDHNHAPIAIAAMEAGKDVYLEKPVSNTIEAALRIVDAAKKYKKVVQVGSQQRSFPHYQELFKMVKDGLIGDIQQVIVTQASGGYGGSRPKPAGPEAIPEGFDWDLWLGPAKKVPYESARRGWRGYYEYGGGGITDWGVHQVDIVQLYMGVDGIAPSFTAGVGMPMPDPELVPNTWSINYKYDKFIMSFVSIINPTDDKITGCPIFVGSKGALSINRWGYEVRPNPKGSWMLSMKGNQFNMGPEIERKSWYTEDEVLAERASELVHVQNWMDCIKSRQKPTCDVVDVGFTSSLPLLLGVKSIKDGRSYTWDTATKTAKPV